jgi:heterodisulfide reductase subunit B2
MVTELAYYPGCTLKTRAHNFDISARASLASLGIKLAELSKWNCCGTVYSLADDDLIHHVASVRNLVHVRATGKNQVLTLCSFCYNTLHRANLIMKENADKRFAISSFMDLTSEYKGEVQALHLLQVLRDDIGWQKVSASVKHPLNNIKIASYYGCTLLRPQIEAIDNIERPTVLQNFVKALGAVPVDFPFATECCGSFQVMTERDIITERVRLILASARKSGAEAIAVSCPLCEYNLRQAQVRLKEWHSDFQLMPLLYFTQFMALAFGLPSDMCGFKENSPETQAWLERKGLLG